MLIRSYVRVNPTISKILNELMFFPHRGKVYEIAQKCNFYTLANMLEGKEATFGQDITSSTESAESFFAKAPTEFIETAYDYAIQRHATLLALSLQDAMVRLGNLDKVEEILQKLENDEDPIKQDFAMQLRISLDGDENYGPYEFDIYTAANHNKFTRNLHLET